MVLSMHQRIEWIAVVKKVDGIQMPLLPDVAWADCQVMQHLFAQNPSALQHAASAIRDDKSTVLCAVDADGHAVRFASERLRADPEVLVRAATQSFTAVQYASPSLRSDQDFLLENIVLRAIYRDHASVLQFASEALRADVKFVNFVMGNEGGGLCSMPPNP